jgi:tripartite-type tricarboxylate transporter receptor subunit TctC
MKLSRFACFALTAFAAAAHAADYPTKPITLVNPYASGGPADTLGRIVAKELTENLGQSVIMQNRPGAGASIGAAYVAAAAPDGYTLLVGTAAAHSVTPVLTHVSYDGFNDFKFIGMAGSFYNVLVVNPSVKANNLKEFIALARANPGKLNFATTGLGTSTHIGAEMLQQQSGIKLAHIPYKGAAPALIDLVGGQVQVGFANISAVQQFIDAGQLRALAYAAPKRSASLPNVPTFAQAGLPGFESSTWYVLAAPAKTPPVVLDRLARAMAAVYVSPAYKRQMQFLGADIIDSKPAAVTEFVKKDAESTLRIIKAANIDLK